MGAEGGKVYSLGEVASHNSKYDCWVLIHGKVFDVTKFLDDHPGGSGVLLAATGKDATNDFEDVGHGSTAQAMMAEYYIGDVDLMLNFTPPEQELELQQQQEVHYNQVKANHLLFKLLQYLVPLIILGLGFGVRFYTKSQ